ncbi:hypothetical protein A6770_07005 [Nostoc minutum NIES-26]|uniref:Uncharacterized protein n=1 Tax=Nostoc minutum NIES-26 TaxID=1844469 RepID=A0A367Q4V7_9NOSO|nr:hypothetical protein A6770_07005 [Nostoc minutum NIES-26]
MKDKGTSKEKYPIALMKQEDYESIERWWEIIFSAYLLVSIQATYGQLDPQSSPTYTSGRCITVG